MAKNNKTGSHGHHGKMSHSSDSPDRVVEYGDKLLQFSRTHVVMITLVIMLVVVGIFTVSKLVNDAALAEKESSSELVRLMYLGKLAALSGSEDMAVDYLNRFENFCNEKKGRGFAPRALLALAGDAYFLAREYLNPDMARISIDAYVELQEKFPNHPMVAVVDSASNRNTVDLRLEEAREFIALIPKLKEKFNPEGLYVAPPDPEAKDATGDGEAGETNGGDQPGPDDR